MNFKPLAFASLALCALGLAQAQPTFAEFTLDAPIALASGTFSPGEPGLSGHWTMENSFIAGANAYWETSGVLNHDEAPWWSRDSPGVDVSSLSGAPFGSGAFHWSGTASSEHRVVGAAQLQDGLMRASVHVGETPLAVTGNISASWLRSFELNPHASVTLSGLGRFSSAEAEWSIIDYDAWTSDSGASSALLSSFNTGNAIRLQGYVFAPDISTGLDGSHSNASRFNYSTGPDGRLALTLTNDSDVPLHAQFSVSLNASTHVPAVPEPEMWLMLCAGALCMWACKRRSRPRTAA